MCSMLQPISTPRFPHHLPVTTHPRMCPKCLTGNLWTLGHSRKNIMKYSNFKMFTFLDLCN